MHDFRTLFTLCCFLLLLSCVLLQSQTAPAVGSVATDDEDRPKLKHQTQPIKQDEPPSAESYTALVPVGPEVAPGLHLPRTGTVWALDQSTGGPQLVRLRYAGTEVNNHKGSNILKSNLGPFVYKPKVTLEVKGDKAAVRLHSASPEIFIRSAVQDDAAPGSKAESTRTDWALLVLNAKDDRRIASTMAFTQFTGGAKRSEGQLEIAIEGIGATSWYKITPKKPLEPGEYGLVQMPRVQNQFPTRIFDFAIDLKAPDNPEAVKPKQGAPQADRKQ